MSVSARYSDVLHLVVALACVSFLVADEQAFILVLTLPIIGASWLLCRGGRADTPPLIPRTIVNLLVLCVIVYAVLRTIGPKGDEPIVSTLGQFLVMLALIKLFDRRAERDDAQLLTLNIFVAIAAVLTSNAMLVGAALIGVLPAAIAAAMLWQVRAGQIRMRAAAQSAGLGPAAQRAMSMTTRGFRHGFLAISGTALLASVVVATALFVVIPRGLGGDILGRFGVVRETRIGFRESVQLGQAGLLSEDPTPVMDVRITTASGEPFGSEHQPIYLRGGARDQYDPSRRLWQESSVEENRWGHGRSARRQSEFSSRQVIFDMEQADVRPGEEWRVPWTDADPAPTRSDSGVRVQKIVLRREIDSNIIFGLWRPIGFTPDQRSKILFAREFGTLRRIEKLTARTTYTIRSMLSDNEPLPVEPELGFKEGPIAEIAAEILRTRNITKEDKQTSTRQIAIAIRDHLQRRYTYTTEMIAPPEGADPIEYFLTTSKQGHCEYFASAMTALCQSAGLPARVVSGYLTAEYNSSSSQYLVRESDAHAWVEVFVTTDVASGLGRWETFDPSPPADIERVHRPPSGVLASLRSWYDALEFGWASTVVGFDMSAQRRLFGARVSEGTPALQNLGERLVSWLKTQRADARSQRTLPSWVRWTPIGVAVFVAVGALAYRWLKKKRFSWTLRGRNRQDAVPAFYSRTLKALDRAGFTRPEGRPAMAHARIVSRQHPELSGPLLALTDRYYKVRFAGAALATAESQDAMADVRRLEGLLNHTRKAAQAVR